MIKVLICGSLTPMNAFLSGIVVVSPPHSPTSSVCRFGRDVRHLTNKGEMGPSRCPGKCTVTNLHQRGPVSSSLGTKSGTEVPHAGSQNLVRAESIQQDCVEVPCGP